VEGVLRKLTGDTPEALPSPRNMGLCAPNAYIAAEYPAIPLEVQALLLEEGVTVTDLSMDDPLAFDSDVSAVFTVDPTMDHDVNQSQTLTPDDTFPSPARGILRLPAPVNVTTYPTPAEPPTVAQAARNATATIKHLKAHVPHDTQRSTERALKQHNQAVNRTHNEAVKKRRTENGLDLGASVITQDVVITPDVLERPTRGTKRRRTTPVLSCPA
jgi:hypothetical protein